MFYFEDLSEEDRLVSLQTDLIIAEILLSDKLIIKNAQSNVSGFAGTIIDGIKSFISSIPGETTSDRVLNFIAPGLIYTTLSRMGFGGKLTKLLILAMSIFHIDVSKIFSEIYDKIKSLISGDKKTTSDEVNSIVSAAVQNNTNEISSEEDASIEKKFKEEVAKLGSSNKLQNNIIKKYSSHSLENKESVRKQIRTAKIIRSLLDRNDYLFIKESGWGIISQGKTATLLTKILGFVFSSILAATGFLVVGDVFNTIIGRSSGLTRTLSDGKPISGTGKSDDPKENTPVSQSTPSKKSVKNVKYLSPSYKEESYNTSEMWALAVPVNKYSISNMLIHFANEVYSNLKDKTNEIMSSSYFNLLVEKIFNENIEREGANILIIPASFHSKRDLVDFFIDDINLNNKENTNV